MKNQNVDSNQLTSHIFSDGKLITTIQRGMAQSQIGSNNKYLSFTASIKNSRLNSFSSLTKT